MGGDVEKLPMREHNLYPEEDRAVSKSRQYLRRVVETLRTIRNVVTSEVK